jgi:hypothetical protein
MGGGGLPLVAIVNGELDVLNFLWIEEEELQEKSVLDYLFDIKLRSRG